MRLREQNNKTENAILRSHLKYSSNSKQKRDQTSHNRLKVQKKLNFELISKETRKIQKCEIKQPMKVLKYKYC